MPNLLTAQSMILSPDVSYGIGYPWEFNRAPGRINQTDQPGIGPALHQIIQSGLEFECLNLLNSFGMYAGVHGGYEFSRYSTEPFTNFQTVNEQTGFNETSQNELTAFSKSSSINIDLGIAYSFTKDFLFSTGFQFATLLSQSLSLQNTILTPSTAVFRGGGRQQSFVGADSLTNGKTHTLFKITGTYNTSEQSFSPSIGMTISYDLLTGKENSFLKSLNAGVTVGFPFYLLTSNFDTGTFKDSIKSEQIAISPSLPITPLNKEYSIPQVKFVTTGSIRNLTVTTHSTRYVQAIQFTPILFFDSDSIAISQDRYPTIASEKTLFNEHSLVKKTFIEIMHYLPDIIGFRLQQNKEISIEILFPYSDKELLGKKRAQNVKQFFINRWNITPSRIHLRSAKVKENLRDVVTITSSAPSFSAPIVTEWIIRSPTILPLQIDRNIDPLFPIRSWKVELSEDDHIFLSFGSDDSLNRGDFSLPPLQTSETRKSILKTHLITTDTGGIRYDTYDSLSLTRLAMAEDFDSVKYCFMFLPILSDLPLHSLTTSAILDEFQTYVESSKSVIQCSIPPGIDTTWHKDILGTMAKVTPSSTTIIKSYIPMQSNTVDAELKPLTDRMMRFEWVK